MASQLFTVAVDDKLLPGQNYGNSDDKTPSIWLGPSAVSFGTPAVERFLPANSRLTDVRFRLLALATSRWLKRAKESGLANEKQTGRPRSFSHSEAPVLLYPVDPGSIYFENTALCRVIGPHEVSKAEQLLIRWAFKFQRSPSPLEITTTDVLNDLKGDALLALQAGEAQAFSDAVDELVGLYGLLIKASACRDTEGNLENYARVPDRQRFFGTPVYEAWSRRLVDLFEAAANRVSSDEAFIIDLIHVPGRLFSQLEDVAHADILKHLIELPPVLFRRLAVWWMKTLEQQGTTQHDACNPASLRPPFYGTYDSILRRFVGTWESLKNDRFLTRKEETPSWQDLQEAGRYFENHLHATARMAIGCIHRGDKTGTEWILTDVLLKWFAELQFRFEVHSYLFRREKLLSFEVIERSWEDIDSSLDIEGLEPMQSSAPKALFASALQNYWIDVCCIVAYMLVIRGKHCVSDHSLPAIVLKAILFGEVSRRDGHAVEAKRPISSANNLFIAILRQYHSEGSYRRGYRARLDHLVERLTASTEEEMVPGRIYSGWGADDLDSLRDGQIILLSLLVPEQWTPATEIERTFREWVREDDAKLRDLERDLKQWKERIAQPEFAEFRSLFESVKGERGGPKFDEATKTVLAGIDDLISRVGSIREDAIRELTVSQARLEEVGRWASKLGFSKTSGAFPLPLFCLIDVTDRELQNRCLVLKDVAKGEYTEPAMAQRAVNEEEWFGHVMRDHVAGFVLAEVISRLSLHEEDASSPEIYWEKLKQYGEKADHAGRHAIFLIENPTIPNWIYEWTHPYRERSEKAPPDLEMWRDTRIESDAYLGNLNKVAVFKAPLPSGASILLTEESLKSLLFTKLEDNDLVLVEAHATEKDPARIDLRLTWRFDLEVDNYPAMKLVYGNTGKVRIRKKRAVNRLDINDTGDEIELAL